MKTKRGKLWMIFILMFGIFLAWVHPAWAAEAGTNPVDVSPNDPAYKAVKTLIDKGYLQLYQDQTFQGDKPVDRYTLALVVGKILDQIATGKVSTNKDDMALLQQLTNEYRDELTTAVRKVTTFNSRVDQLEKQGLINQEDTTATRDQQAALQKEAQQLQADLLLLSDRVQKLEEENAKLKVDLQQMKAENDQRQQYYIIAAVLLAFLGLSH